LLEPLLLEPLLLEPLLLEPLLLELLLPEWFPRVRESRLELAFRREVLR